MGRRLAHGAVMSGVSGYLDVHATYGIVKLTAPEHFVGRTLKDLGIGPQGKQGTAALIIQRGKDLISSPAAGETVQPGDTLILAGNDDHLTRLLMTEQKS